MRILTLLMAVAVSLPAAANGAPLRRVADGPPRFDIAETCRAVAKDMSGSTSAGCMSSEDRARAELAQRWDEFPPAERSRCSQLSGLRGFQSYVELLTCLELGAMTIKARKG